MSISRLTALGFATAGCALFLGPRSVAQKAQGEVRFAKPVRLKAGDAFLGKGRLYPSPVLHDVDGDGKRDVVIGDLRGLVTVARAVADKPFVRFAAEKPLEDRSGKPLKFHNW